jgi:hypothetical protein
MAKKVHGTLLVGPKCKLLNELFASDDAETFCDELVNSNMIVKCDPGKSKLLNHIVSFQGSMYKVLCFVSLDSISN